MSVKFNALNGLSAYLTQPDFKMPDIIPANVNLQNAEHFSERIREVIERLQSNLKPDEQLQVYYTNGVEVIRVGHICMSSANVAVVSGIDAEGNPAQVIAHFRSLQFVSKIVKVDSKKEKTNIGFSNTTGARPPRQDIFAAKPRSARSNPPHIFLVEPCSTESSS